ncbi:RNase J family beta-CASP ribonuclease, partial [Patescibacteria group bacterium]|nr:RNase J family beta-CASP ribonuclease [Patescibacteria group bacterium]
FFQKPAPKPQTAPKPQASPQPQHAKHPQRGGRPFYRTNRGPQQGPRPPYQKPAPYSQPGAQSQPAPYGQPTRTQYHGKLRIIPLGGLNEIGKNCMALEYENDIIIIDMGFQFPEADLLGVDYIIPDITWLKGKEDRIRGIIFTHGHLDHIGAVSYLIPELKYPQMYGAQLTMSLIQKQLEEFGLINQSKINVITVKDTLRLGAFNISFFGVNHSIPDSLGVVVKAPAGNIVHTGDFKFDMTPSGCQMPAEFDKISALAHQDIAALFIDSTNALKPGHTITEQKIGESLDALVKSIEGRIIIASFSSQIGRLQQIVNIAAKYDRKIILSGRSLIDNFEIASKIGYLRVPQGMTHDLYRAKKIPPEKTIVLTTGSQGEDVAALSRMSLEEHSKIKITKGDTVILSSTPIPGNERAIITVTNNLARLGARIINNQIMDVHASGHAQQEDLKLMMTMVKPKAVVPIHGEYVMRVGCKELATSLGYSDEQGIIIENGGILEVENNVIRSKDEKVETKYIMVDGLGVGDIGAQVIMDRQTLAENGVLIILITVDEKTKKIKGEIEIISRGFVYMKESEALIHEITELAKKNYTEITEKRADLKRNEVKKYLRESIDKLVHQKIERSPLILPIIIEK